MKIVNKPLKKNYQVISIRLSSKMLKEFRDACKRSNITHNSFMEHVLNSSYYVTPREEKEKFDAKINFKITSLTIPEMSVKTRGKMQELIDITKQLKDDEIISLEEVK